MTRTAADLIVPWQGARTSGLVLASTTPTTLAYAPRLAAHPVSLCALVTTLGIVAAQAGVAGALIVVVAFLAACTTAVRFMGVRHAIDRCREDRARFRRGAARNRAIAGTGSARQLQYGELHELVATIERTDPPEARRLELEELLDHFVRVAVEHERCNEAVRLAETSPVPSEPPPERRVPRDVSPPDRRVRARAIAARRLAHRDTCKRRIEQLADELDAIEQMVRLVAQRVACPRPDANLDGELERRLWELEEVDAALDQLSA